jgi:hypothetical protein
MESRQYIVLTGDERVEDLDRILGKIKLPNPVSISYRHTGHKLHDLLVDPFVAALKGSGVKEVATLFAEPWQVDQLRKVGLEHGIDVSES